nr:cytochrome P450 CYP72A219-like [Ipomoea batatas]
MPLSAARNVIRDMDRLPTGKDLGKVPFNGFCPICRVWSCFNFIKEARKPSSRLDGSFPNRLNCRLRNKSLSKFPKVEGKNCYVWMGPMPMVFIRDPELVKEVLNKHDLFQKPRNNPLGRKLVRGLASYEKEQWAKHRRLLNPAFYSEKLKLMQPAFLLSCSEMLSKWEGIVHGKGSSCEVDVCPDLQALTCDVISRTAFGSSYEEGKRIFELLKEQAIHFMEAVRQVYIPGWR